jgi:hypothetical protein
MWFPLFLVQLAAVTAYAGWAGWSPSLIPLFGAFGAALEIGYFATQELIAARGHTFVFLLRKWAIDSMVAAALYGTGFAIKWLLG